MKRHIKKNVALIFFVLVITATYFLFFHKNRTLKYIPKNADVVAVVDVKKSIRYYLYNLITHPSEWSKEKNKTRQISLKKAGIKIPDFVQIFHLKGSDFLEWYSVLELSDKEKFLAFLGQEKFLNQGKNIFKKDKILIKILGEKCVVMLGSNQNLSAFEANSEDILSEQQSKNWKRSDEFIENTFGSFSFITKEKIRSFPIEIGDDYLEIKSPNFAENLLPMMQTLAKKDHFLEMQLDRNSIKTIEPFYEKSSNEWNVDSLGVSSVSAVSKIEEVKDTIVSYEYDDNFNEIEKISFQKILQPNYHIALQSENSEKTWLFFQQKKWINEKREFTKIPFLPNEIIKKEGIITILSKINPIPKAKLQNGNYIFLKNNTKLINSFSSFSKKEKDNLSKIQTVFYYQKNNSHYFRIQMNTEKIPFVLTL